MAKPLIPPAIAALVKACTIYGHFKNKLLGSGDAIYMVDTINTIYIGNTVNMVYMVDGIISGKYIIMVNMFDTIDMMDIISMI